MKLYLRLVPVLYLLVLAGCQKEITGDVVATGNGSGLPPVDSSASQTGNYTYYYQATIDGVNYKEVVTETNGYEAGSGASGTDDVVSSGGIIINDTAVKGTSFGIGKGTIANYLSITDAQFKSFFNPATYPFSPEAVNGVDVSWGDKSGTTWSTDQGSEDQTGSVFKITDVREIPTITDYYIQVTAEFNCKLYDTAGHVKQLTNGKAVCIFGKI